MTEMKKLSTTITWICLVNWVFPKIGGKPPKWMVKIMENPMNKWMDWGYPYFWKHPVGDFFASYGTYPPVVLKIHHAMPSGLA